MAQITPKMALKGFPNYCLFMACADVHNLRVLRPFWARKWAKISPKMASIAYFWASKWTQIFPKWPQNDSQMTPNSTLQLWSVLLYIIWGHSGHFWVKKGVKLALNL